jgi:hypothetical protein
VALRTAETAKAVRTPAAWATSPLMARKAGNARFVRHGRFARPLLSWTPDPGRRRRHPKCVDVRCSSPCWSWRPW